MRADGNIVPRPGCGTVHGGRRGDRARPRRHRRCFEDDAPCTQNPQQANKVVILQLNLRPENPAVAPTCTSSTLRPQVLPRRCVYWTMRHRRPRRSRMMIASTSSPSRARQAVLQQMAYFTFDLLYTRHDDGCGGSCAWRSHGSANGHGAGGGWRA